MLAASLVCYWLVRLLGSLALAWYEDTWQSRFTLGNNTAAARATKLGGRWGANRIPGWRLYQLAGYRSVFTVRKGAPFLILNKNDYIETINANIDIGNHQVHILVEQNPLHPPFQTPGSAFRYVSSAAKLVWAYYALQTATVCIYKYSNNLQAHKHLNGVSQQSLQVSVHSKPIRTSGRSIMVLRYQRIWDVGGCPTTQRAANSLTNLTTGNRMQQATSTDFLAPLLFLSSVSGGLAWPCDAVCLSYHP